MLEIVARVVPQQPQLSPNQKMDQEPCPLPGSWQTLFFVPVPRATPKPDMHGTTTHQNQTLSALTLLQRW